MAIRYRYDLYPHDDPRDGARILRFTKLQQATYRDVVGVGSGAFSLRSTDTEADSLRPDGGQYVRVVREDSGDASELVVGGFWVDKYRHKTADRNLTKRLVASGAGTMAYLARARMAPHTYIHDVFTGMDPYDDVWRLSQQSTFYANGSFLGAMLWRVIYEAQHFQSGAYTHRHKDGLTYTDTHSNDRTVSVIPDVVMGFDQFEDSDGNPWTATAGEFTAQVLEPVLSVVQRLMNAGLYVEMDPDTFELRAWENNENRRDRTGSAWGASVVRFQSPTDGTVATGNILNESEREIEPAVRRSLMWAGGNDVYSKATQSVSIPWEGGESSTVLEGAALSQLAETQLAARNESADKPHIRIKMGRSPTTGRYLPFEEVRIEDLVTVHTGTGEWDYDEATYPVAALRIELQRSGAWHGWAELGDSFGTQQNKRFQTATAPAHQHSPNPELCRIGFLIEHDDAFLGEATSASTVASLSDHPAWSGIQEEHVEMTVSEEVPVGDTVLVYIAWNQTKAKTRVVYDERGNAYTKDADHENGASSLDNTAELWRSVVTTALQPGDYIRYAAQVTGTTFGGRAIKAHRFSGALSAPVVGTGAGTIGPTLAVTAPAGDVVAVVGATTEYTTLTDDPDWQDSGSPIELTGSSDNSIALVGQYLLEAASTSWSAAITPNRDWAAIAVGYTRSGESEVSGDLPLPTVATDEQHTGTSVRAARCDHEHEHGLLSTSETHYHDTGDIEGYGAAVRVGVKAFASATQGPITAEASLALNSEVFDTDGFHDNATNNSRLTVPSGKAGVYHIVAQVRFAGDADHRFVHIKKNGTDYLASAYLDPTDTTTSHDLNVSAIEELAVGDYVEIRVFGGGTGVTTGLLSSRSPSLAMMLISS